MPWLHSIGVLAIPSRAEHNSPAAMDVARLGLPVMPPNLGTSQEESHSGMHHVHGVHCGNAGVHLK